MRLQTRANHFYSYLGIWFLYLVNHRIQVYCGPTCIGFVYKLSPKKSNGLRFQAHKCTLHRMFMTNAIAVIVLYLSFFDKTN